ncbi:phage head-tail adapter protein [Clostridium chromiireducens]|uniref:Phage head-tail adapter protein n=1 Tax=Clostridium chromiireducens TaxID=225345 RepID=A0A964RQ05_9CLOT|nr:phage head-tail adapter protein [Clostridium chromiireducens]MVX65696.1 phage head-tail adapter protein [Clostridium chromiireducens]
MNAGWSDLNKRIQLQIKKKDTFYAGIDTLLELRKELMKEIMCFKELLNREDFNTMPFINAKGYHNKTIAYSLYHIFRIEDIVSNSLIGKREQIFFKDNYRERMKSPIMTTGNELIKQEISIFSSKLDLDELYQYISDVDVSTTQLLKGLSYEDLKIKMNEQDEKLIKSLDVVSNDDNAVWLIDYWCDKNIQGLIQMPFSRHWIMHIEASLRIKNKINKK